MVFKLKQTEHFAKLLEVEKLSNTKLFNKTVKLEETGFGAKQTKSVAKRSPIPGLEPGSSGYFALARK